MKSYMMHISLIWQPILMEINKKEKEFEILFYRFNMKIWQKPQNLMKFDQKNVLLRSIAWIISLEKPCYLENRAVREPCKRRSACI